MVAFAFVFQSLILDFKVFDLGLRILLSSLSILFRTTIVLKERVNFFLIEKETAFDIFCEKIFKYFGDYVVKFYLFQPSYCLSYIS